MKKIFLILLLISAANSGFSLVFCPKRFNKTLSYVVYKSMGGKGSFGHAACIYDLKCGFDDGLDYGCTFKYTRIDGEV